MARIWTRLLFWSPRIICILFAAFLGVFAADVFGETRGFWATAVALFVHLIPSTLVLLILAVAWRRDWLGGLVYLFLAALYMVGIGGRFHWSIPAGLALIALLFFANWWLLPRQG